MELSNYLNITGNNNQSADTIKIMKNTVFTKDKNPIAMLLICTIIVVLSATILRIASDAIEEKYKIIQLKENITQEMDEYQNIKNNIGDIYGDK